MIKVEKSDLIFMFYKDTNELLIFINKLQKIEIKNFKKENYYLFINDNKIILPTYINKLLNSNIESYILLKEDLIKEKDIFYSYSKLEKNFKEKYYYNFFNFRKDLFLINNKGKFQKENLKEFLNIIKV